MDFPKLLTIAIEQGPFLGLTLFLVYKLSEQNSRLLKQIELLENRLLDLLGEKNHGGK